MFLFLGDFEVVVLLSDIFCYVLKDFNLDDFFQMREILCMYIKIDVLE